jgi:hypothetical protein
MDISRFRRETSKVYLQDQEVKRLGFLKICLEARDSGTATEQQLQFLKRYERVAVEEQKRIEGRGVFGKSIDRMFPGIMAKQKESTVLVEMDNELEKAWEVRQAEIRKQEAEALERRKELELQETNATSSKGWLSRLGWK